jgi:cytochrome c peroxidase
MKAHHAAIISLGVIALLFVVASNSAAQSRSRTREPIWTRQPQVAPAPKGNPTTPEKVLLGKELFFDPRLSEDNSMSCATCHLPEKAFADGRAQAKGRNGKVLSRNVATLLNIGFYSRFMWDGRAASLEQQALLPIQSSDEMHQDLSDLERELVAVPSYAEQFKGIFGTNVTRDGIAKALAAFERTLVTKSSAYDRYLDGEHDALTPAADRGRELFFGDAGCVRCHSGPQLSDGKFYRLGVSFKDDGVAGVTGKKEDRGKFRTSSLPNVATTAPYTYDGSLNTLEDVVTFYYRTASANAVDDSPLDIEPLLGRSYSEIPVIVAFLESLTGEPPPIVPPEHP